MQIFSSLAEWQTYRATVSASLGFVPTMGNLHAGHASLLTRARAENAFTVLSIFINPTQFNQTHDFENYPKTLDEDLALARALKVDAVLLPTMAEMYPDHYYYQVHETALSQQLCGQHRSGHFKGMLTVVLKLLLLVKANRAYFGEKDFQQLQLIQGLVQAFFLSVAIIACPTQRDVDGLALSSRNRLLTSQQRQLASHFPRLLSSKLSPTEITTQLTQLGFKVDYIEDQRHRRFGAVRLGDVRLIDNVKLDENVL